MSPDLKLTPIEAIAAENVRTAAQFPVFPSDLFPELRVPVVRLRSGENLTDEEIVAMVNTEVQHNSNF